MSSEIDGDQIGLILFFFKQVVAVLLNENIEQEEERSICLQKAPNTTHSRTILHRQKAREPTSNASPFSRSTDRPRGRAFSRIPSSASCSTSTTIKVTSDCHRTPSFEALLVFFWVWWETAKVGLNTWLILYESLAAPNPKKGVFSFHAAHTPEPMEETSSTGFATYFFWFPDSATTLQVR